MNSHLDNNHVATLIAVSSTDGSTIIGIKADPATHIVQISDGSTGTDFGPYDSKFDENHIPTLLAVSSRTATVNGVDFVQGVTPVVVYADSSGNLLTQST